MIKTIITADANESRTSANGPAELWALMGRPLLSYVLDLSDAVSDREPTVFAGSEIGRYEDAFPDRTVHWIRSDEDSFSNMLQRAEGDSDTEHLLFLRGNMPLIDARSLQELIDHHERTEAVMTLLSGTKGSSGFACRLEGRAQQVASVSEENSDRSDVPEENRDRSASPVALVNREQLQSVMDRKEMKEEQRLDSFLVRLAGQFIDLEKRVELYLGNESNESMVIDSAVELSKATEQIRKRVITLLQEQGVRVLSPEQTYIEPDVEIGAGTVIEPFVVIRNGVKVGSNCHLGPFCQIREGTHLEDQAEIGNYVETKNSRVGRKTKAKHLSYLGDATIGEGVNIGAGTITANYDGSEKHRTVIEDYASTGSDTVLIAPVTMKKNSKTGAGSVVTRGSDVPEGATVVGIPARRLNRS